jgi:hypothetical protein
VYVSSACFFDSHTQTVCGRLLAVKCAAAHAPSPPHTVLLIRSFERKPRNGRETARLFGGDMTQPQQWQNRIIGYGTKKADQFCANPDNPRRHPQAQRDAVKASLDTLGWIGVVVENVRSGYLIDGHERVMQALLNNDDVPYIQVDLSEDEEKLALASFDWITYMAQYDKDALDGLLRDVNTDNAVLQQLLSDLAVEQGIIPPEPTPAPKAQIDRAEELQAKWQVKRGDLWVIPSKSGKGEHRLLCGDSTNAEDVARLQTQRPFTLFLDPVYNITRDEFLCVIGHFERYDTAIALAWGFECSRYAEWLGAYSYDFLIEVTEGLFFAHKPVQRHKTLAVWDCSGNSYQQEALQRFENKTSVQRFVLRDPKSVSEYKYNKPLDLVMFALSVNSSTPYITDPYLGSGTSLVAAEQLSRVCYGVELDPAACAVALQRLSDMGLDPHLVE